METIKYLAQIDFSSDWWILLLPVIFMVVDFITGILNAWIKKCLKSFKMREGLGKKAGEILIIVCGELLTIGLGVPEYVVSIMSLYILFMETISIFENLEKLGVPIPKFVSKAIGTTERIINNEEPSKELLEDIKNTINGKEEKRDE